MAVLRNRYHERAWFLGRHAADPDETIEVPDVLVEERDADGKLIAGLAPDDAFWERIDAPGLSHDEFHPVDTKLDAAESRLRDDLARDEAEDAKTADPPAQVTPEQPASTPDAPTAPETTDPA